MRTRMTRIERIYTDLFGGVMKYTDVTDKIIKAYYTVYNTLGYGFLEKVYENAMYLELRKLGLLVERQVGIDVFYQTEQVGNYYADLIVNKIVIIELKAVDALCEEHSYQLINYLKATSIEVGLLLNFGKKPEIRRKIFDNVNKNPCKSVQSPSGLG